MRALILVAGAALAVSACSSNEAAENTMNVDETLTTENVVANDTTAIDAHHQHGRQHDDGRQRCRRQCVSTRTRPTRCNRAWAASAARTVWKGAAGSIRRPLFLFAGRPPCAPGATAASAAAPSPARSRHPSQLARSAQSIGWTRKLRKSQPSRSAGSIPCCGQTSFSSSPDRCTTSVPAFGLMHSQSMPGVAAIVPLLSTATRKPREWSASIRSVSSCSIGSPPVITTSRRSRPSPHSASTWSASASADRELAAARSVGPDEIRIAEIALRRRPILLAPAP